MPGTHGASGASALAAAAAGAVVFTGQARVVRTASAGAIQLTPGSTVWGLWSSTEGGLKTKQQTTKLKPQNEYLRDVDLVLAYNIEDHVGS